MKIQTADTLARIILIVQAILIPVLVLGSGLLMQQGLAEGGPVPALTGPMLWGFLVLISLAWIWLCRRAWSGYLSDGGMLRQWPFWVLVAVQLPSFPLGTLMGAGLIFLKIKFHPRRQ